MQAHIEIVQIQTASQWRAYYKLPWQINHNDPNWIAPVIELEKQILDFEKHPFWRGKEYQVLGAFQGGELLSRVIVFTNPDYNKIHHEQAGFFGFLETTHNPEAFALLMGKAEEWLRARGCLVMMGPFNPSLHYELGILTDGFDTPPFMMMTHNPPYYNGLLESVGLEKTRDFHSYLIQGKDAKTEGKIDRIRDNLLKWYKVTVRNINLSNFDVEAEMIRQIYNDAFSEHWGYVPFAKEEFHLFASELKRLIVTDFMIVAELNNEPIAFILALPNYNEVFKHLNGKMFPFGIFKFLYYKHKIKGVRVITVAVRKKFQHLGIGSLFYPLLAERVVKKGYEYAEMSWVIEENVRMNSIARLIGGTPYKKYRLYQKALT